MKKHEDLRTNPFEEGGKDDILTMAKHIQKEL